MQAELITTFRFDAAHALPNLPPDHKCRRMHGHSYRVDIHITGPVDERLGWVMDFTQIKRAVQAVLDRIDHRCLNEIPGLENSTSEILAKYLWDRIAQEIPGLSAVTIWESETSRCVYRGT
ncbi:MAG TPA: 6-carboxytetrahydropterin synthase QueD [Phycisphaerales bacterium]|nr:6-carboxytetrahydropterin synthase QueD [Phycisphaerales bacterium]